jgi:hypothetical protein
MQSQTSSDENRFILLYSTRCRILKLSQPIRLNIYENELGHVLGANDGIPLANRAQATISCAFPSAEAARPGATGCPPKRGAALRPLRAAAKEVDLSVSGVKSLSAEARERVLTGKLNPQEKLKLAKCGSSLWTEVYELADLLRKGETNWEDLDVDDLDVRSKWSGIFHRRKRSPGLFMMRFRVRSSPHPIKITESPSYDTLTLTPVAAVVGAGSGAECCADARAGCEYRKVCSGRNGVALHRRVC